MAEGKRKCMRIGLFGTSRSGKNYTIDEFISLAKKDGHNYTHLSPMDMIRERLDGRKLRDMSDAEKRELVRQVRDEIDEVATNHDLIVDEHYCYPESFGGIKPANGYFDEKIPHDMLHREDLKVDYEVVFPRFEYMKYDMLAVINISPEVIVDRCKTSEGVKNNTFITVDDAREWQRAEMEGIMEESHRHVYVITDPKRTGQQLYDALVAEEICGGQSFHRRGAVHFDTVPNDSGRGIPIVFDFSR